jgi:Nuclease-related domain.
MDSSKLGNIGEEAVREILRSIKGSIISGFIRSKNIQYYGKNFQLDFLVFVPKIGLVIIEVKRWKGTIKATSQEKWKQETGIYNNEFNNASLQVLRTSGLLLQILEKGNINKWPIRPVVVFAHDEAKILKAKDPLSPQTDIILKSMIPTWLINNSIDEVFYKFTEQEFHRIKQVIQSYTSDYIEQS